MVKEQRGKKKGSKLLLRELQAELHYWQMQVRMDVRSLRSSRAKCKVIGEKMRELQKRVK